MDWSVVKTLGEVAIEASNVLNSWHDLHGIHHSFLLICFRRNVFEVRPEPPLNVPVWHEMTEAASEQARPAEDLFVDPEFPATNESIGGVKGGLSHVNLHSCMNRNADYSKGMIRR